jgi:hypothetical protein
MSAVATFLPPTWRTSIVAVDDVLTTGLTSGCARRRARLKSAWTVAREFDPETSALFRNCRLNHRHVHYHLHEEIARPRNG